MENVPEALRLELANVAAKIEAENFMVLGWRNNAFKGWRERVVLVLLMAVMCSCVEKKDKADGGAMLCEDVRQSVFGG